MNIFISVAGSDRPKVEEVALALRGEGHRVFLDEHELPPGESFHRRIREAIQRADLVVFFVSPRSLQADRYTMTELQMIQDRWPHPRGRVLPTLLEPVDPNRVPPYLRAVSFCKPQGNLAASVAYHVSRMSDAINREAAPKLSGGSSVAVESPLSPSVGFAAAVGLALLTAVLAVLADRFVRDARLVGLNPFLLQGLLVTLLVWLAAVLYGLRSPLHFLALAAGGLGAYLFEYYGERMLRLDPVVVNTAKSALVALCAAVAIPQFRAPSSLVAIIAAGAVGGVLAQQYAFGVRLEKFLWETLLVFVIAIVLGQQDLLTGGGSSRGASDHSGERGNLDSKRAQ